MNREVAWPSPPRDSGGWNGGPPVAPQGNTALPPLPGDGGVMATSETGAGGGSWSDVIATVSNPMPTELPAPPSTPSSTARVPLADRLPYIPRPSGRIVGAVLAVIVLLGAIGVVTYRFLDKGPSFPTAWDARVLPITEWVAQERGLEFNHPVDVVFLTDAEYTARTQKGVGATDKLQLEDQQGVLRSLGLISGKVDLVAATKTLRDDGTLAFYDQNEKKVFVRGTDLTPALRVTLAHELTHVLQDQHFDLTRVDSASEAEATVLRALAEGDATRIEEAYRAKVLTPAERIQYWARVNEQAAAAKGTIDATVPVAMTTWFQAPYILGPKLISHLAQTGGNPAVDDAFTKVPSETALFDGRALGSPTDTDRKLPLDPPGGAKKIDDGTFGATAWYLVLAGRLPARQALRAVDGVKGDAYVEYRTGDDRDRVCVRATAQGATQIDASQLKAALDQWAAQGPKGAATVTSKGDVVTLTACDPGSSARQTGSVTSALLVLPAVRTNLYDGAVKGGQTPDVARCYSDAMVRRFTTAQLTSTDLRAAAAARPAMLGLLAGCQK